MANHGKQCMKPRSMFGRAIRKMRMMRDKTLQDAADEMGRTRQYLSLVETGGCLPPMDLAVLEQLQRVIFRDTGVSRTHLMQMAYVCRAPVEIRAPLIALISTTNPLFAIIDQDFQHREQTA